MHIVADDQLSTELQITKLDTFAFWSFAKNPFLLDHGSIRSIVSYWANLCLIMQK